MAGKLSPSTQVRLAELATLGEKLQRAHGMVERFAADRHNPDQHVLPMGRTFQELRRLFSGAGLDAMSQLAGSMEVASRRTLTHTFKVRVLREGIGSLRFQLELEQRTTVSSDRSAQAAEGDAGAASRE